MLYIDVLEIANRRPIESPPLGNQMRFWMNKINTAVGFGLQTPKVFEKHSQSSVYIHASRISSSIAF